MSAVKSGAVLTYAAAGMFGGFVEADRTTASRALLALDDGSRHVFELPADRAALDTALAVLASGIKIGRWQKANELRAVLGVRPIKTPNKVP